MAWKYSSILGRCRLGLFRLGMALTPGLKLTITTTGESQLSISVTGR